MTSTFLSAGASAACQAATLQRRGQPDAQHARRDDSQSNLNQRTSRFALCTIGHRCRHMAPSSPLWACRCAVVVFVSMQDCIECLCPQGRNPDGTCVEPIAGDVSPDEQSNAVPAEEVSDAAFTADADSSGYCLGGSVRLVREGFWREPGADAGPIYRCVHPNLCKGTTKDELNQ